MDISVLTTNADGPNKLDVPIGEEIRIDGVKVFYYPIVEPRSYFRSPQLTFFMKEKIKSFSLVHINWLYAYTTMTAARECIRRRVPYILSPRGMLDRNAIAMKGSLKKNIYLNLIERKHLCNAELVHFTSSGEREQALSSGWGVRSVVVPNGINLSEFSKLPNEDSFIKRFPETDRKRKVLFLGRVNYIKGLDLLSKAWPVVVEEIPNAHLILAGPDDNGYGQKVRNWLSGGLVENSVTFTGALWGEDKLSAFSASDIFVSCSYLESFGMAIVEAMACGKPVVITDRVNICHEIKEAGAGIVTPCDPQRIAEAIISILKNPDRGREMGIKGRELVQKKFSSDIVGKRMLEVYRAIVTRHSNS